MSQRSWFHYGAILLKEVFIERAVKAGYESGFSQYVQIEVKTLEDKIDGLLHSSV
jgi:hypothetical protein